MQFEAVPRQPIRIRVGGLVGKKPCLWGEARLGGRLRLG